MNKTGDPAKPSDPVIDTAAWTSDVQLRRGPGRGNKTEFGPLLALVGVLVGAGIAFALATSGIQLLRGWIAWLPDSVSNFWTYVRFLIVLIGVIVSVGVGHWLADRRKYRN